MDSPTPDDVVSLLSPALPYLLSGGKAIAGGAAKKVGEDAWSLAKKVWKLIAPHLSNRNRQVGGAAPTPSLVLAEVKQVLERDPDLMAKTSVVWTNHVSSSRNVSVEGSVRDSTIIAGDHNAVQTKRDKRR